MENEPQTKRIEEPVDIEKSPLREAYVILGATTPKELSLLYTRAEQPLFISHEWDYGNPAQTHNHIKEILEAAGEEGLTEDEKEWRKEILWFWYHHAVSAANWKMDKVKMREFSAKALEYQENPNILTRLMYLLSHDRLDEAEFWVQSKKGDDYGDEGTAWEMIAGYKEHGYF